MLSKLRFNTVVGKKLLMAITGLAMCIFLVGHLVGNLQLLWNKDQFNGYAHFLTISMAPVVAIMELGLLGILILHVVDSLVLLKGNYDARPVGYYKKDWGRSKSKRSKKSWSSTLMMWSGTTILVFIAFHVWHFKYHHPVASEPLPGGHDSGLVVGGAGAGSGVASTDAASAKDAYNLAQLVVNEFHNPLVSLIYLVALFLLGMHLYHAVSSALTSVGGNSPRYQRLIMWGGNIFTVVIVGGFMLIPILVLVGFIK